MSKNTEKIPSPEREIQQRGDLYRAYYDAEYADRIGVEWNV